MFCVLCVEGFFFFLHSPLDRVCCRELDFVTIVTSSRALAAGHTEPPLAATRVLTCWVLRVGEGWRLTR